MTRLIKLACIAAFCVFIVTRFSEHRSLDASPQLGDRPDWYEAQDWGLLQREPPQVDEKVEKIWAAAQNVNQVTGSCGSYGVPVVGLYEGFMDDLFTSLERNRSFGWIRFGDGEMFCLGTHVDVEISDAVCNRDTRVALVQSLQALPKLRNVFAVVGTWWLCAGERRTDISLRMSRVVVQRTDFIESRYSFLDVFYMLLGTPSHRGLVRSLQGRDVVLVGPSVLSVLRNTSMFHIVGHVPVPFHRGSVFHVPPILKQCSALALRHRNLVFLVAFGIPGKVLVISGIQHLPQHTFIDVGSSLDAYAGIRSRDYNKDLDQYCKSSRPWMAPGVCEAL
eukprot:TRINITY_DN11202_c0_g1_i1.p1 TRINITY_DN11202_c0_g1~~TRINITY_DN11202_c0_g1_i1.p1  ORF type:complete len:335 (+),score=34.43 TRINITY_DN11202_c0_g1_i1:64-1068(+)